MVLPKLNSFTPFFTTRVIGRPFWSTSCLVLTAAPFSFHSSLLDKGPPSIPYGELDSCGAMGGAWAPSMGIRLELLRGGSGPLRAAICADCRYGSLRLASRTGMAPGATRELLVRRISELRPSSL